jgi:hypothetical protein
MRRRVCPTSSSFSASFSQVRQKKLTRWTISTKSRCSPINLPIWK